MDPVTHGLLGAALAVAVARPGELRLAAAIGAAAGLLPDVDTFIQDGDDPLLLLDFHRHFTHAWLFIPVGALIAALLAWPLVRQRLEFRYAYRYALAGYALASTLDACTSYGTHLWWPFSAQTEAWGLIAVFDPLFTLLLGIPLLLAWRRDRRRFAHLGLVLALAYLGIGAVQHARVSEQTARLAAGRGHQPEQIQIKPTLANLLLWRSVYIFDGRVHVDAHRAGLDAVRVYPGQQADLLTAEQAQAWSGGDPHLQRDLERFRRFSDNYLIADPARPAFIGDARYAMLPDRLTPIWGIERQAQGTTPRIRFVTRHDAGAEVRTHFLDLLLGRLPAT